MTAIETPAAPTGLAAMLEGNPRYVVGAVPGPLPIIPARRTVILSCVDPRVDPARILDLDGGECASSTPRCERRYQAGRRFRHELVLP